MATSTLHTHVPSISLFVHLSKRLLFHNDIYRYDACKTKKREALDWNFYLQLSSAIVLFNALMLIVFIKLRRAKRVQK